MVEAKKLGEDLQGAVSQGVQYCLERGTQHFAVTDGQRWAVYETHRPVPIEQEEGGFVRHCGMTPLPLSVLRRLLCGGPAYWKPAAFALALRRVVGLPHEETVPSPTVSPNLPTEPEVCNQATLSGRLSAHWTVVQY